MKKKLFIYLSFLLMAIMPWVAQGVTKVGTTAASFLNVDIGAKAVGMGGAYVAVADDISAMFWNPAGIARLQGSQAMFNHTQWLADMSFNYAAVTTNLPGVGAIGVNAAFLSMDDMEVTTTAEPDGTGEMFGAGSYAFGLCYARSLTDRFSIGFNFKYIREQIYHSTASGLAFDIGTLFDTRFNGLKIGMSIANYGAKMEMDGRDMLTQVDIDPVVMGNNKNINASLNTDSYDLPLMFRVGISMDVLKGAGNSNLILSMDALHPNNDDEYINIGTEYLFNEMFALRAGYKSLFANDSEQGLSFGAGIQYKITGQATLFIDYAFQDFGILNNVQKFSVSFGF